MLIINKHIRNITRGLFKKNTKQKELTGNSKTKNYTICNKKIHWMA